MAAKRAWLKGEITDRKLVAAGAAARVALNDKLTEMLMALEPAGVKP